jgi:dimeric dUTPase (all-alpha-NTP-PPase superfamily)
MDLKQLFDTQLELDIRIKKEKDLIGVYLLQEKIIALQVELGEFTNELPELFKFWSNKKNNYEKALIEYVDALHFLLSIGNDINYTTYTALKSSNKNGITLDKLSEVYELITSFKISLEYDGGPVRGTYETLFNEFLNLGRLIGFTEKDIEQAYYVKNEMNHTRQSNGY